MDSESPPTSKPVGLAGFTYNPVEKRQLVTVDPKDPTRWLQGGKNITPYVTKSGDRGYIDGYKGIHTLGDVTRSVPSSRVKVVESVLQLLLEQHPGDKDQLNEDQVRAAAMVLAGVYGPEVTLTGIDPSLKQIMTEQFGDIKESCPDPKKPGKSLITVDPKKMTLHGLDEEPGKFLITDEVLTPEDWEQNDVQGEVDRTVGTLTPEQVQESERRLKETWKKGHDLDFDKAKMGQAMQSAQKMDQQRDSKTPIRSRIKKALTKKSSKKEKRDLSSDF